MYRHVFSCCGIVYQLRGRHARVENLSRDVEEGGADIGVGQDEAHATIDLGGVPQEHSAQGSQSSIMRA